MTEKDSLLAPPRQSMTHGSVGKSHVTNWMQSMDAGQRWDHNGTKMQVPQDDKHMHEYMAHGMYWMVIKWEAVEKFPEKIAVLMKSLNADQHFAMTEHAPGMLKQLSGMTRSPLQLQPGQSMWAAIRGKVLDAPGAAGWSEDDLLCLYNAAMVLSPAAVDILLDDHFQW